MKLSSSYIICIIIIGIPVIRGIYNALKTKEVGNALNEVTSSCSLIVGLVTMFSLLGQVNDVANAIIVKTHLTQELGLILKMVLLVGVFALVNAILYYIFKFINKFIMNSTIRIIEENAVIRFISSMILGAIKGFLTLIIVFIAVIFLNKSGVMPVHIGIFENIKAYNVLEQSTDASKISNIRSGLLQDSKVPTLIYYNGVTLAEGVKSDAAINEKARELTKNATSDLEKARILYAWIGSNITYDDNKAEEVMAGDKDVHSGAIAAFNTRTGICFDYACLYVAMAREVGLPVRIITGKAFNGEEYISHAWNQVYIKSLDKWINVDPTFYKAGNYFDNSNFNEDHEAENIAGQWD